MDIRVDFAYTGDAMVADIEQRISHVLGKGAFDIEGDTKLNTAVRTGNLRASWQAIQVGQLEWRVGSNVEYAPYYEFGTRRMAPRAPLTKAVELNRNRITEALQIALKQ